MRSRMDFGNSGSRGGAGDGRRSPWVRKSAAASPRIACGTNVACRARCCGVRSEPVRWKMDGRNRRTKFGMEAGIFVTRPCRGTIGGRQVAVFSGWCRQVGAVARAVASLNFGDKTPEGFGWPWMPALSGGKAHQSRLRKLRLTVSSGRELAGRDTSKM